MPTYRIMFHGMAEFDPLVKTMVYLYRQYKDLSKSRGDDAGKTMSVLVAQMMAALKKSKPLSAPSGEPIRKSGSGYEQVIVLDGHELSIDIQRGMVQIIRATS